MKKSLIRSFKKTKKFLSNNTRKLIVVALLLIVAIATIASIGYVLVSNPFQSHETKVEIMAADQVLQDYIPDTSIEIELKIWVEGKDVEQPVSAVLLVNDQAVATQQVTVSNSPQQTTLVFESELLEDGEHTIQAHVTDDQGEIIWEQSWQVTKDTTPPALNSEATLDNDIASLTVATDSGKIQITSTQATDISLQLNFTEAGTFQLDAPDEEKVTWTTDITSTPTITISSSQTPFTSSYTFNDQAGQKTEGELSYYYDNVPPTFTIKSALDGTNEWGDGYVFIFTPSEPVKNVSVTKNGQSLETYSPSAGTYGARTTLSVGDHTFVISATDMSNNTGTKTVNVTMSESAEKKFPSSSNSGFRICTQELRSQCMSQAGYGVGGDCDAWRRYVDCLKPKCDSRSTHNICGNSWE